MTTWPSERIPEYLALVDAANGWQRAYDVMCVIESRTLGGAHVEAARADVQRAINAWHHRYAAWLKATNDNRKES